MGTLGDLLVLGEGPSIVADAVRLGILKSKKQTLIFGPMRIENVEEIPTFRTDFSNFPWQLLGARRPAGFSCLKLVAVHSAARCWL